MNELRRRVSPTADASESWVDDLRHMYITSGDALRHMNIIMNELHCMNVTSALGDIHVTQLI